MGKCHFDRLKAKNHCKRSIFIDTQPKYYLLVQELFNFLQIGKQLYNALTKRI